ncbi:hypothetical protein R1sor_005008 [Riccia sorocarpa]|uniref:Uncharacterized protein n=1 Tax=Riccia sorocarpa TaxID=122646 RepID=A0ABD3HL95_9MARC
MLITGRRETEFASVGCVSRSRNSTRVAREFWLILNRILFTQEVAIAGLGVYIRLHLISVHTQMVGWIGAAALALMGGLKGQGNPWRQIPLVGVLAATAMFISMRVRHGRDKATPKPETPDEKTVAEVNTREYLVYDEEKKLDRSLRSGSSHDDSEKLSDTDEFGSSSAVEDSCENSHPAPAGQSFQKGDGTGEQNFTGTPSKRNESKVMEPPFKGETTPSSKRKSLSSSRRKSTSFANRKSPARKTTDITSSGIAVPTSENRPEIPSVVGNGEPYVYDIHSLQDATDGSLSYSAVAGLKGQEKDIAPEDDYFLVMSPDTDSKDERVLNVVKSEEIGRFAAIGDEIVDENENGVDANSGKFHQSPIAVRPPVEGFVSTVSSMSSSPKASGLRKEGAVSVRESPKLQHVRAPRITPELQLNDWVSRRGDSELEDGRLNHPASAGKSDLSVATPGAFPFSNYSASESCSSEVTDYKDEFLSPSEPSNVKRVISDVKEPELESVKSAEEEYAERLRSYDMYLADSSLSPRMRSQVLRAKATLERLLYDSD